MSGAHTPGPWDRQDLTVFALDEHGRVNRFWAHIEGGYSNGGQRMAFGDAPVRTEDAELLATACLMEAAPELLEALEACRDQFDFYAREHRAAEKHEKAATNERFAFLASQAIAKARGAA